jgi:class 3 adenylate cyclase
MRKINRERRREDLALNIGLHEGPCLAVILDDRRDYFGLSVNIAVQELADPTAILATKPIVDAAEATGLVGATGYRTNSQSASEAFTIHGELAASAA